MTNRVPQHIRMVNNQIHQVHIADGFADDCEELIHQWLKSDLYTYETFCEIWKDMQFDSIFHGRPTGAEIGELSEEVINIAKHYMVANTDNFEESVAGLFLVYALINLQPYNGFAALRIVPEDVPAITHIEMVARRTRRYDVLYILGSVLTRGPVQYHAVARERGMESSIRKYLDGTTTGIDRVGVRPKGVFYRQTEELDLLRELNNITKRYAEAKKNIPDSSKSLNYTNQKFATELDSSLKGIINGILDEGAEGNKKITDHYTTVQAIKEKAMRQSVDSVKFLSTSTARVAADAEKKKAIEARKFKRDVKSETSKKQVSPKKVSIKRRCTLRANAYRCNKRKRAKNNWSSSSDSDVSVDLTQDDGEDSQPSDIDELADPNTDVFKEKTPAESDPVPEKEVDVDIAVLPVFIRSEQDGSLLEIEIADKTTGAKPLGPIEIVEVLIENGEVAVLSKNGEVVQPANNKEVAVMADKNDEIEVPAQSKVELSGKNEEVVVPDKNEVELSSKNEEVVVPDKNTEVAVLSSKTGEADVLTSKKEVGEFDVPSSKNQVTKTDVKTKDKSNDMAEMSKVNDSKDTNSNKGLDSKDAELSNEKGQKRVKSRRKTHIEKIDPTLRRSTRRSIENRK